MNERLITAVLRAIPQGTRGKRRLARALLPAKARAREAIVILPDGSCVAVPNRQEPVGFSLWMDGVYEPETLRFLEEYVQPGSVFLDIGANIGAFTIPLARRAAQVIAIEPSPSVLPFLRENVERNQLANVAILACAASEPGCASVPLYIPPERHFGMASSAPQFGVAPVTVEARTVDAILLEHGVERVSAVKVDTEGFEAHVFLGAQGILRGPSPPPIIFEFCDWAEERAFPGRKGWAQEVLLDAGYSLWTVGAWLSRDAPLRHPLVEGADSIVALPRGLAEGRQTAKLNR